MSHTSVSRPRVIANGKTIWSSSKGFGRFGRNCGGCSSIDSRANYWLTMPFFGTTTSSVSMQFNGADQRYDSTSILHEVQVEYALVASAPRCKAARRIASACCVRA
jgi:hypothetical protein